ncbi:MAG: enoyl-CoA hydratase/isomerase family protein [Gammaproteobacteria bacterium]|nr:enoyl-CoA hydratase/isomerase family protein [Gammaproteobacteria bacterium]
MHPILDERGNGVARITLNRPARRNAINAAMLEALAAALGSAQRDPDVRVIVLTAAGEVFSSGDDLDELPATAADAVAVKKMVTRLQDITRHIMLGRCPVVCAVRGWAIGAGASWPLNADFTLWSETARLRFPEARHALFPSGGATWLLADRLGDQQALEILLSGEALDTQRLLALGVCADTLADDTLETALEARVHSLLTLPPATLEAYKRVQAARRTEPLEAALAAEAEQMIAAVARLTAAGAFPQVGGA